MVTTDMHCKLKGYSEIYDGEIFKSLSLVITPCSIFIGRTRQWRGSQAGLRSPGLARGPTGLLICAGYSIQSPTF